MADIENERRRLNQLNGELTILMGDIEKMEERIRAIRKEGIELYKEIDKKLNGD